MPESSANEKAERIYSILNRTEVRRDPTYRPSEAKERILLAIKHGKPIEIVGFWGGHKQTQEGTANHHDEAALDLLKKTADRISQIHPVRVSLLFSDVHSSVLNSIPLEATRRYQESLRPLAEARSIALIPLSELYRGMARAGETSFQGVAYRFIEEGRREALALLKSQPDLHERLTAASGKHNRRVDVLRTMAGQHPIIRAQMHDALAHLGEFNIRNYAALRLKESRVLDHNLVRDGVSPIYFVFGDPSTQPLLPDAPHFYWYSTKKGEGQTPWFMSEKS